MVFFDHTVVAVSPRVSSKGGVHPPGFRVCWGTAILFHGDTFHAISLPDGYGGERKGMQFRGWTLKSDLDNFLEARTLGRGEGTNNPLLGDLLVAGFGKNSETQSPCLVSTIIFPIMGPSSVGLGQP